MEGRKLNGNEAAGTQPPPSFTIRASDPDGVWLMVKFAQSVSAEPKADPQLKAKLSGLVRQFEIWYEAANGHPARSKSSIIVGGNADRYF